ncbi:YfhO family protein [Emticicia sp. BO119]|uniref:YfhO family protein n=1 Tax=Emticicia sp. BO119 TaxID=2757768 RepID=UPI0015F07F0D|nr:YfhO family protein [Emticicia sp. BO119]MBA4851019.1 YfhO family protein [Emticicia sp. BO119]
MKKKNKPVSQQNIPQKKQDEVTVNPTPKILETHLSNNNPLFTFSNKLAWGLITGLLAVAAFFIFKDFLLSKKTTLYLDIGSDMTNAFYPIYKMATDYFQQYGMLSWSFKQGMGQDISPFMNSPFYFLYYLGDGKNIPLIAGWIEFLRIIVNGLVFFWFLKTINYNNYTSIVGGVCFALMGFTALVLGWTPLLANSLLYSILLLIGIEQLLREKKWYLIPIATMLIAVDQPFNFTIIAEFTIIYLLVRLYVEDRLTNWLENGKFLAQLVAFSALGIGMGFLICYSHILLLLNSPRGSGDVSYTSTLSSQPILQTADSIELFTTYLRWFSNDILGYAGTYKGWQNYMEAPAFYVGIGMLLLLPQLFVMGNRRERIAYGVVTGLIFIIMTFPYFRYIFWLFTGNYYRVMAAFIAVGLLLGCLKVIEAIIKGYKINLLALGGTFLFLQFLLLFNFSDDLASTVNKGIRTSAVLLLFIYALLFAATRVSSIRKVALCFFLGITFVEMIYFDNQTLNKRSIQTVAEFKSKAGFNDYTLEAIDYIRQRDKSFFRVEKNYSSGSAIHESLNDAMVQNYQSTSSYHSFNHRYYVAFMNGLNTIPPNQETATRWIGGVRGRPLLMPLTSVKYYLVKGIFPFQRFGFDSLTTFQDVKVFKNTNALPMGFTLEKYMTKENFEKLSTVEKDASIYRGFVINNDEKAEYSAFGEIKDSLQSVTVEAFNQLISECRKDTLQITSYDDQHFDGTIDINQTKLLFLSIPFDKGWKAEVDGKPAETRLVTFGMTGIVLDKGKHQVKLYYEAPYLKTGSMVSGISFVTYGLLVGLSFWRKKKPTKLSEKEANDQ